MEKSIFFNKLKDALELDTDLNEESGLNLTSLATLTIIVLIDENFGKQVKASEIRSSRNVKDLIILIGPENFN